MPSKIVQFQSMPDGSLVVLDSNGSLWQGRVDSGNYTQYAMAQLYGQYGQASQFPTALSNVAQQQNVHYQPGTGKLKWTKISE